VTVAELEDWFRGHAGTQRDALEAIGKRYVDELRALDDDELARAIRLLKKKLGSPKLAGELAALLAAIHDGRVARPAAPAPPAPSPTPRPSPGPIAPDATEAALVAAIEAAPEAHAPYLVYGDWLESHGDPRGELIAYGAQLAKHPGQRDMRARHRAHVLAAIMPALADLDDVVTDVTWHMGFIAKCRVALTMERFNAERPDVSIADLVRALVDDPAPARFLQHLTVGIVRHDDQRYQGVIDVLAARPRPALRTLHLGDFDPDDCELNWSSIGDCARLWPMVPGLRALVLRSGDMRIGPVSLPALERLATITGGLDEHSLRELARADWPSLVELSLQVGPQGAGDVALVAPLLDGGRVPVLRRLGILNCNFTDELCDRLPAAPVVAQLEVIDLSMGSMSDAGAAVLAAHADKLAHAQLIVEDNYLSPAGIAQLAAAFPRLVAGDQRDAADDGGRRYGAAYE
jgi:uncharacterized protein (TIGR02996 family)